MNGEIPINTRDMPKNIQKSLQLFFEDKPPLHAAMDKYEKIKGEYDQFIEEKQKENFQNKSEILTFYYIEALLIEYQIAMISITQRTKKLISVSKECDIHKTNQLYLRECINSNISTLIKQKIIFSFKF